MRHETCLTCQVPRPGDPDVQALILIAESFGGQMHHHHTVRCDGCGQWWSDDLVMGGLGIPVPRRRDTELCACEDDLPQYARAAVLVPMAEDACSCTKADAEKHSLPIRLGTRAAP